VEWSGTGINLRVGNPTPSKLLEAVTAIFEDSKYKKRVLEIKAEISTYDPMGIIADTINEVALNPRKSGFKYLDN
jgi:UDP:flavonoid glycosyltransferase YjiC (YdhE family)